MRRLLRVVPLVLVLAVTSAACGSSGKKSGPTTTTTTTTTSSVPTASSTSSTTTAPSAEWIGVWPTAASADRYHDPVTAARAFATSYLHFFAPIVGPFRQGDARSGEVTIRSKATGPVTTVLVRQLRSDGSWSVLGAATPDIELTEPAALATITSPVRLRGSSSAFEATVQVSILQDDIAKPLRSGYVMGGSLQMGPFDATFNFAHPTSHDGAILLYTISPEDGHVSEATVLRVRFSDT